MTRFNVYLFNTIYICLISVSIILFLFYIPAFYIVTLTLFAGIYQLITWMYRLYILVITNYGKTNERV